ncbi:AGE family epimerase/isomerase [Spirosoma montaniterrae]|uniref:Cellobiose 2-epimerase n=1 Tax=Spirosoma montaniterrae TaxID=1178516 RepID=A0A1P9WYA5_9BACT|nr:AGE family epimerase/isomerase [Spirosoma montaniterrae]AQG80361.1 N-acyl-D-glucosamine 2-epimerase [Spirosoma montaniterrae]
MVIAELRQEHKDILAYWQRHAPDPTNGGFYGRVDYQNRPDPTADKGIVLNARILWTFSAALHHTQHDDYRAVADRAFDYIRTYFIDPQYGGVYWSVDYKGQPKQPLKQLYGQAFALYGLSEYARATGSAAALDLAKTQFQTMVKRAYDPVRGGFREAFARDWSTATDYILSKPANRETKTMNTHLHILEAFTCLYRVWPDASVATQMRGMIGSFLDHIVDPKTYRMNLFMDDDWRVRRTATSYGHDIEASWLLPEAADLLAERNPADKPLQKRVRDVAVRMARAASAGLEPDGGMNYEFEPETGHLNRERSWWVMAEAMVGYLNAYQLTREQQFLDKSLASWTFIKKYLLDTKNGEWFSGVTADHRVLGTEKISMWKCPYHNSRACLEMLDRLEQLR